MEKKNLDNNYFIGAVYEDLLRTFDCIPHDLTICLFDLTKIGYDGFIDTLKREPCLSDTNIESSLAKKYQEIHQN